MSDERRAGKTSEPHLVPLTPLHIDLLDEIKLVTNHSTYLFPSQKGNGPRRYDSLTHAVRVFVNSTEFQSFSPRDLRRTFKTMAASFKIPLEMLNRLQGHALTDVGSVYYNCHEYLEEKQDAMKCWSDRLTRGYKRKRPMAKQRLPSLVTPENYLDTGRMRLCLDMATQGAQVARANRELKYSI